MTDDEDEHCTRELGAKYGRQYFAVLRAEPDFAAPIDWALTVSYKLGDSGTNIVRIDTYPGGVHMDRLYEPGEPKDHRIDVDTIFEAAAFLEAHGETYAERHRENRE